MLHHFAARAADGEWHCVYRLPGTDVLVSVGAGLTQGQAQQCAREKNQAQHDAKRRMRDYQQKLSRR